MESHEEFEARRQALREELNDEPFFGPFIVRNGRKGLAGENLIHTGYSVEATTASRQLKAWILRPTGYWCTERSFVVSREQVGFPFFYLQGEHVNLLDLLESVFALRTKKLDLLQLVLDLEPVLKVVTAAPLKKNALHCLLPAYADLGFAVAPPKLQKTSVVMRIVWVYPQYRETRSISHYLPVGTLKFSLLGPGQLDAGAFEPSHYHRFLNRLGQSIADEHRRDAWQMLSSVGQAELTTLLKSHDEGGHPRTKEKARRLQFVAERPQLWSDPSKLAVLLREAGLYSAKITGTQLVWQTQNLIERAKEQAAIIQLGSAPVAGPDPTAQD